MTDKQILYNKVNISTDHETALIRIRIKIKTIQEDFFQILSFYAITELCQLPLVNNTIHIFFLVINRNHRSAAPTALLSPMANQLVNTATTRQVNKVKPNVNRNPPET